MAQKRDTYTCLNPKCRFFGEIRIAPATAIHVGNGFYLSAHIVCECGMTPWKGTEGDGQWLRGEISRLEDVAKTHSLPDSQLLTENSAGQSYATQQES